MSLVFKQVKVYARLSLVVAVVAVILLVIWNNRSHDVDVWFFGNYEQINVLWLILFTSLGSIFTWWVLSAGRSLWRDMGDLKRAADLKDQDDEQQRLAKKLADTQKRIDEKLSKAIRDEH